MVRNRILVLTIEKWLPDNLNDRLVPYVDDGYANLISPNMTLYKPDPSKFLFDSGVKSDPSVSSSYLHTLQETSAGPNGDEVPNPFRYSPFRQFQVNDSNNSESSRGRMRKRFSVAERQEIARVRRLGVCQYHKLNENQGKQSHPYKV